jgi:CDP-glucose 4,6-dehydratase
MAAQPLVRRSYNNPVETYATNVLGTVNVLESVRHCDSVRAVLIITTDKCYENRGSSEPFRESDRLGGHDPYSGSKACAEVVVSSYRDSFFHPEQYLSHGVAVASARAGNVIGGGDWAEDRLIPDMVRAFCRRIPAQIRNPNAVRPWQHVLEPLRGYLSLCERLVDDGPEYGEAWNFGPVLEDAQPVAWLVERMAGTLGPAAVWEPDGRWHPHEAQTLRLDWSMASSRLNWHPKLRLAEAIDWTADWYLAWTQKFEMRGYTQEQIQRYSVHDEKASVEAEG